MRRKSARRDLGPDYLDRMARPELPGLPDLHRGELEARRGRVDWAARSRSEVA